jgi:hypothetical protein
LFIALLSVNCTNEEHSERQEVGQSSNINKANKWFKQYKSTGKNYDLFENLKYNWSEAEVTNSNDGTETIIVPVKELKKNKEEIWEQKLYVYKLAEGSYKALLVEIYPDIDAKHENKSIDVVNFNDYISVWDLKEGFVKSAKFVSNVIVENGVVEVLTDEQLKLKSATNKLAPKNLDEDV